MSTHSGWWLLAYVVVGMGALALLTTRWTACQLREQHGRPEAVVLVAADDGASVVLRDRVRNKFKSGTRLTAVDAATGRQTALRVMSGNGGCGTSTGRRIWCELDGLVLLDGRTLATIVTADPLIAKLGSGRRYAAHWYIDADGRAHVLLDDGSFAVIDPDTKTATAAREDENGMPQRDEQTSCATIETTDDSVTGLLGATVLLDSRTGTPIADDTGVLVLHASSLDPRKNRLQLSRVDRAYRVVWTVAIHGCQLATVVGTSVVIAGAEAGHRVRSIDVDTGKVSWTFRFPG